MSQIASRVKSSVRYVIDLLFVVCVLLMSKQALAIAEIIEGQDLDFCCSC